MQEAKEEGHKIVMLTAYDCPSAQMAESAGIAYLLVGDSLGMVCLGYESTVSVTMSDMLHHLKAVKRGVKEALIIADMPFMSYSTPKKALKNAALLMQEGGAQAVKLEGGTQVHETVQALVANGVPVMGHLGLTPQSVNILGGYQTQATNAQTAKHLLKDALALQQAGAFAVVLEMVPAELAQMVSCQLHIPVIGIGAGPYCDGQVQVFHDLAGLFSAFLPKHAKRYTTAFKNIKDGICCYIQEVQNGTFPSENNFKHMPETVLQELSNADLPHC